MTYRHVKLTNRQTLDEIDRRLIEMLRDDGRLPTAITSLEIRSSDHKPVIGQLKRIPEIARIHATNGRWDLIAEIRTGDLAALAQTPAKLSSLRQDRRGKGWCPSLE